mgnify:CR=1 FL=1
MAVRLRSRALAISSHRAEAGGDEEEGFPRDVQELIPYLGDGVPDLPGWLARLQPAEILYDRERVPPACRRC